MLLLLLSIMVAGGRWVCQITEWMFIKSDAVSVSCAVFGPTGRDLASSLSVDGRNVCEVEVWVQNEWSAAECLFWCVGWGRAVLTKEKR